MKKLAPSKIFRKASVLAVVPVTAALLFLSPLSPASAATGTQLDNTDPIATGCANDAVTIATQHISNVDVDIRYSPSCSTNWVRVTTQATDVNTYKTIGRDANAAYGLSANGTQGDWDNGSSYSMQIYAPGSTCVHANVSIYWGEYSRYFINDWVVC